MILYHGSEKIIEKPVFGYGRFDNDYGQGFYCTGIYDMAAEWACASPSGGFVNQYDIDLNGLKILDLNEEKYHILNWLTVLLKNRKVRLSNPIEKEALLFLTDRYDIKTVDYDIIKGYRADDSYFSFCRAFLSNTITIEQLSTIMKLGELGTQYMIKSRKAFNRLHFVKITSLESSDYFYKRNIRDKKAKKDFYKILNETDINGHTVRDLIRGDFDDEKLRLL